LYTENDLDKVMTELDTRLNNTLGRGVPVPLSGTPLFRAVVPVRFYGDQETAGLSAEMAVKHGLATAPRARGAGHILKMGGVCKRWFGRYFGLRIFFFS
jgi:hypothetical protein